MGLNLRKDPGFTLVWRTAIVFFLILLVLLFNRYLSFSASYVSFDQGIFNQVFWNSLHGHLFQSSLSSTLSTEVVHDGALPRVDYHRLGQHFTPALMIWLPWYALAQNPMSLMVLQVTLVTAAGLVLYALARHYLEPTLAAWITMSFYGANAVVGPTLANFHDLCQIPLLVFSLLWAIEKGVWRLFWPLAIVMLLVREDAGVGLFGIGVYLVLSRRYPKTGLFVCLLSFGYMVCLTNWVMPLFSEDVSRRFMIERFGQYIDDEEASTLEVLWAFVSKPFQVIWEIVTPWYRKVQYLAGQWLPLAFIPSIAPAAWMIAGFPLLAIFLHRGESPLSINIRYAMTVVPGLFYGTILWWAEQHTRSQRLQAAGITPTSRIAQWGVSLPNRAWWRFWAFCLTLSVLFTLTSNPNRALSFLIPDSYSPWVHISLVRQWQHARVIRHMLTQIPDQVSVAASSHIVAHLSSRREVVRFPLLQLRNDRQEVIAMEYAIADLWQLQQYGVAFDDDRDRLRDMVKVMDEILQRQQYGLLDCRDGVVLLHRGIPSQASALEAWKELRQGLQERLEGLLPGGRSHHT